MTKPIVVLYHRGCNDGIVAAWAVFAHYGKSAKYLAYQYGEELPAEVFGAHVIMVDLSLPESMLEKLRSEVESVLIIDHHKTAAPLQEYMRPVKTYDEYLRHRIQGEQLFIFFDRERSGAVLTWAFFGNYINPPLEALPLPLKLIQDYDLWQHQYPDTKALNAWLINGGLTIERVAELMSHGDNIPAEYLAVGNALMKYDDKIIRSVLREYLEVFTTDAGMKYVMVNAPHHLRNEIGDRLSDKFDFVVLYTRRKERTVYSLRARKGGFDTSTISEMFGGGGHAEASAFSIAHPTTGSMNLPRLLGKPPTFLERLSAAWGFFRGATS
jgi:oligoribonuclease NrnB/cAMP/cGMP phosphodiesterase (DHH superfamily)